MMQLTSFENVINVAIGSAKKKSNALRYLWYNIKIPAILKKYKAGVFISCDGIASLTYQNTFNTLLLQILASYITSHLFLKKGNLLFYKTFTPREYKKSYYNFYHFRILQNRNNRQAIQNKC
jgi:hypothetical protein